MTINRKLTSVLLQALPILLSAPTAVATPIPFAYTSSEMSISVAAENVVLSPWPNMTTQSITSLQGAAVALGPQATETYHEALGSATVIVNPGPRVIEGGALNRSSEIARIDLAHSTLARSQSTDALFARVMVTGAARIDDINVEALDNGRPPALSLSWSLTDLGISTQPSASFAYMSQMLSIVQSGFDATGSPVSAPIGSLGFSFVSEDGQLSAIATDLPNSSAVRDWLGSLLSGTPAAGSGFSVHLSMNNIANPAAFSFSLSLDHLEYAAEAPPAAAPRLGLQTGSLGGNTQAVWDAETGLLTVDPMPITLLSEDSTDWLDPSYVDDPLSTGSLKLDPLRLLSVDDGRAFFAGGSFQLLSNRGDVLYRANTPSFVFDERYVDEQGFNLFAPILNQAIGDANDSDWLSAFARLNTPNSLLLPELFISLDIPGQTDTDWGSDFIAPIGAVLSFAGREYRSIPSPPTLLLLVVGLVAGRAWPKRMCGANVTAGTEIRFPSARADRGQPAHPMLTRR